MFINNGFDELVGKGKEHLEPSDVNNDICELIERTKALKTYVNKTVAHLDKEKMEKFPTIKDLDDSIDLIVKLVKKYYRIIHADSKELKPVPQRPWKNIFKVPWLPEIEKRRQSSQENTSEGDRNSQ